MDINIRHTTRNICYLIADQCNRTIPLLKDKNIDYMIPVLMLCKTTCNTYGKMIYNKNIILKSRYCFTVLKDTLKMTQFYKYDHIKLLNEMISMGMKLIKKIIFLKLPK